MKVNNPFEKMKTYFFLFVSILITSSGQAQVNQNNRKIDFSGEQLVYHMEYMNFHVAMLFFKINSGSEINDSEHYHLTVSAKSTGKAKFLFSINNVYETVLDKNKMLPVWAIKKIRQKNIKHELTIKYNHSAHQASLADSIFWFIPSDCYDYFSMLYFLRTLSPQQLEFFRFFLDSEYLISEVEVALKSENEILNVPAGQFKTTRVEITFTPWSKEKRPWKTDLLTNRLAKPGSVVTMWFSEDDFRLPLKISYGNSIVKTFIVLNSYSRGIKD